MNPELRQTLQRVTRNIESVNEAAQENIYTFAQTYIDPCISGVKSCVYECTAPCFPSREDQMRRRRGRSQARSIFDFDFYDDWDEDELGANSGAGWENGELDGLLAGRGTSQPRRQRAMSYGTRRRNEVDKDPNVIPKSSYLGFLERLPFKLGSGGIPYKPSAANLEENPGGLRIRDVESTQPLLSDDEESYRRGHKRQRSGTGASRSTATSHSSRGDLIMSDEEDDAVPIDDEFATAMLSRRTTGTGLPEDQTTGKGRRPMGGSRISSRTVSTRSTQSQDPPQPNINTPSKAVEAEGPGTDHSDAHYEPLSLIDLKREEERLRQQEELEIVQKREAAQKLAQSMGLNTEVKPPIPGSRIDRSNGTPIKSPSRQNTGGSDYFAMRSPTNPTGETEPFPNLESPRAPQSPFSMRDRPKDQPP